MKVDMDAFDEILNKLPSDIGGSTADIYRYVAGRRLEDGLSRRVVTTRIPWHRHS